jgi:hypothetical protein
MSQYFQTPYSGIIMLIVLNVFFRCIRNNVLKCFRSANNELMSPIHLLSSHFERLIPSINKQFVECVS